MSMRHNHAKASQARAMQKQDFGQFFGFLHFTFSFVNLQKEEVNIWAIPPIYLFAPS